MLTEPKRSKPSLINRYFAFLERRSFGDRILFHLLLTTFFAALLYFLIALSSTFLIKIPVSGGTLNEGIIGTPRFINPALAITTTDHDVTTLLYRGLMKIDPAGDLVPDIASAVTLNETGTVYSVTLRNDIFFHDGSKLTARDVAFTVNLIQNPELKSPLRGNWENIAVTVIDDQQLTFTLGESYLPFIENLTLGIMPRALWQDIPIAQLPFSQLNTEPVGTGFYSVSGITRNQSGLISQYTLTASPFNVDAVNIETINLKFYQNESLLLEALTSGAINSTGGLSRELHNDLITDNFNRRDLALPRTIGLFFNQNRSTTLRDDSVRAALAAAIDRDALVAQAVRGQGIPTDSPVPAGLITLESVRVTTTNQISEDHVANAIALLEAGDWVLNDDDVWEKTVGEEKIPLRLTISTVNSADFQTMADFVADAWRAIGIDVSVDLYEQTDLVQAVIRPRTFEVLLFGNDNNRTADLYPYWHSSQRDDPGLNITQYTNVDTDVYLQTLRSSTNQADRDEALQNFLAVIKAESPAIFLLSPTFTYVYSNNVTLPDMNRLSNRGDRFVNIADWYIQIELLWPFFTEQR